MATLDAIKSKIAKLEQQAAGIVSQKSAEVLGKIREMMDKHGLNVADVETHLGKRRGRKPGAAKAATEAKPKATVAPKYRDPKTGATWTGRGRAPAWILDVKNRDRFLIENQDAAAAKTAAAKKAPAAKKAMHTAYLWSTKHARRKYGERRGVRLLRSITRKIDQASRELGHQGVDFLL